MDYRKFLRPAVLLLAAALLAACTSSFKPLDSSFKPKGRSLAVVSGTTDNASAAMAHLLGEALQKHSRYQVMPQKQIAGALSVYPQNIKGPYRSAYFDIDVDWKLADKKKIAAIQKQLGVDYLYVVWAPAAVSTNNRDAHLHVISQLYESPAAREVGRGRALLKVKEKDPDVLKKGADKFARQLAERTGMSREAKAPAK